MTIPTIPRWRLVLGELQADPAGDLASWSYVATAIDALTAERDFLKAELIEERRRTADRVSYLATYLADLQDQIIAADAGKITDGVINPRFQSMLLGDLAEAMRVLSVS